MARWRMVFGSSAAHQKSHEFAATRRRSPDKLVEARKNGPLHWDLLSAALFVIVAHFVGMTLESFPCPDLFDLFIGHLMCFDNFPAALCVELQCEKKSRL